MGPRHLLLSDGLGSTMKTYNPAVVSPETAKGTDSTGAVVNAYTYDVYGNVTSSSGAQANEFQFAGEQTDPTGLQYLRARYYDPTSGTFISREPLSSLPGWSSSPYGYVQASPVNATDPLGLAPSQQGRGHNCRSKFEEIKGQLRKLQNRKQEYKADYKGLPNQGPNSRQSHQKAYDQGQNRLQSLLKSFFGWPNNCGGPGGGNFSADEFDLLKLAGEYASEDNPLTKLESKSFWDKFKEGAGDVLGEIGSAADDLGEALPDSWTQSPPWWWGVPGWDEDNVIWQ